ncbi:hypothetical protein IV203_017089 [Nitzschia inconspicua]|uniref:Uncharacterized protein n=1 Tax=Nitzschia inconspicua TaxID=303405 RepID=A0A9K3KSA6_9STRA|nr:hypothetical protein IV203_017089 [Nitzschia inconspicua]
MKSDEISSVEASSNKKLSGDMEVMAKKLKSNDNIVAELQRDVRKAKDSRRPLVDENIAVKQEIRCLEETIGSFSEYMNFQEVIIEKLKEHIHEGVVIQKQ